MQKNYAKIEVKEKLTAVVYSFEMELDACAIIRIIGPMRACNWNIIWASKKNIDSFIFDIDAAKNADIIIIQRQFPSRATKKQLYEILSLGIPVIYDLDDMVLNIPTSDKKHLKLKSYTPYIKWMLRESDAITVSTNPLKKTLKKYTSRPIEVIPNLIDTDLFGHEFNEHKNTINILVSGTNSHQEDWSIIIPTIESILNKYQKKVHIIFFGDAPDNLKESQSITIISFLKDYHIYANTIKKLNIHIALTPLMETKFNECKSNIKWLEYSTAGIPGIYSDITPYNTCIKNNVSGLLVKNNFSAWYNAIILLIENPAIRYNLVSNAKREIDANYSIKLNALNQITMHEELTHRKHKRSIFSKLPILHIIVYDITSSFLDRVILWRFKNNNSKS